MKSSRTIRLTRSQYRSFSSMTKAVGLGLVISTATRMGCWGEYSPWSMPICGDAADANGGEWSERATITLARSINAEALRSASAKRPELDWSVLEDHEIYPFILQHEIGHRLDNFNAIKAMMIRDLDVRDECLRHISWGNEILADRFAWQQIRPGEALPLSQAGAHVEKIESGLAYLRKHVPPMSSVKPLAVGQYRDVPASMLSTIDLAGFVGPAVSKALLSRFRQGGASLAAA